MREYTGRYFKIQYPANWIIAGITAESTASYLQTVQFRPSTTSAIEINVSAMPDSNLSIYQLLHIDPHVKLGTLGSTHTVTYHKIPWAVGVVDLASSSPTQANKLEIAYSKQTNPYRIEFGATPDTFEQYSTIFNAMLASFYPQIVPTITPTTKPSSTATPLPTASGPAMKEYNNQHFKILYPANWVITSITTGGTSLQTVQFRPSATSTVFVKVDAMYMNNLSGSQLLNIDPDVTLGTLVSTSTVTYHGIPWSVGIVNLTGSILVQPSKLSNQANWRSRTLTRTLPIKSNLARLHAHLLPIHPLLMLYSHHFIQEVNFENGALRSKIAREVIRSIKEYFSYEEK